MSSGIRIHHPDPEVWGSLVLVPHPGDPATGRQPKDYWLRLDADGNVVVSEVVWQRLEEARASGLSPHHFLVLNEVGAPPTVRVDMNRPGRQRRTYRQFADGTVREVAPRTGWKDSIDAARSLAPPGVQVHIERSN